MTSPRAYDIVKQLEETITSLAGPGVNVITTEDMTREEKEMALFHGFLKEGYPQDVAERKAREWLLLSESLSKIICDSRRS